MPTQNEEFAGKTRDELHARYKELCAAGITNPETVALRAELTIRDAREQLPKDLEAAKGNRTLIGEAVARALGGGVTMGEVASAMDIAAAKQAIAAGGAP